VARAWLERAVTYLHAHVAVRCMLRHHLEAETATAELLVTVLKEKEAFAIEQVFLLLHILKPKAGFRAMHETLVKHDARARASTREVLVHLLPPDLKRGLDALTDELSDRDRLEAAVTFFEPPTRARLKALEATLDHPRAEAEDRPSAAMERAYHELLDALAEDPSEVLESLLALHRAELDAIHDKDVEHSIDLAERAFSALRAPTEDVTHAWR